MAASTSFVEKKFLVKGIWITTPQPFSEEIVTEYNRCNNAS